MYTTSKQSHRAPHLRIRLIEDNSLPAMYVQPIIQQYESTTAMVLVHIIFKAI